MDLLWGRHVGRGDRVVAKLRDAQLPCHLSIANGNGEDIVPGVVLLRRRDCREIAREPFAIEASLKHLGVADRPVRSVRIVHAVQRKRSRVQIALRHNACCVDKLLVLRAARHGGAVEVGRRTQRLQVGVHDRVRLRQQSRGLRRSGLAQDQHNHQRGHQRQHQQQRIAGAFTHR